MFFFCVRVVILFVCAALRACVNGHKACVEVLQRYNADATAKNLEGKTPRDLAIARKHDDLLELCWTMELMLAARPTREELVERGVLPGTIRAVVALCLIVCL